ncbi:MAG: hypothetical protein AAGH92_06340 [Planctomycetota bacterium]
MAKAEQVEVENVNVPGQTSRVNAAKYHAMRDVLLHVLPEQAPGLTQKDMFAAVKAAVSQDIWPGGAKAGWWAKTVQLDLEAKGIIRREADQKPLRWHLA